MPSLGWLKWVLPVVQTGCHSAHSRVIKHVSYCCIYRNLAIHQDRHTTQRYLLWQAGVEHT